MAGVCLLPGREAIAAIRVFHTELLGLNEIKLELARLGLGWSHTSFSGAIVLLKDPRKQGRLVARRTHGLEGPYVVVGDKWGSDTNSTKSVPISHVLDRHPTAEEWAVVEAEACSQLLQGVGEHLTYHEVRHIATRLAQLHSCQTALAQAHEEAQHQEQYGDATSASCPLQRAALRDKLLGILCNPQVPEEQWERVAASLRPWDKRAAQRLAKGPVANTVPPQPLRSQELQLLAPDACAASKPHAMPECGEELLTNRSAEASDAAAPVSDDPRSSNSSSCCSHAEAPGDDMGADQPAAVADARAGSGAGGSAGAGAGDGAGAGPGTREGCGPDRHQLPGDGCGASQLASSAHAAFTAARVVVKAAATADAGAVAAGCSKEADGLGRRSRSNSSRSPSPNRGLCDVAGAHVERGGQTSLQGMGGGGQGAATLDRGDEPCAKRARRVSGNRMCSKTLEEAEAPSEAGADGGHVTHMLAGAAHEVLRALGKGAAAGPAALQPAGSLLEPMPTLPSAPTLPQHQHLTSQHQPSHMAAEPVLIWQPSHVLGPAQHGASALQELPRQETAPLLPAPPPACCEQPGSWQLPPVHTLHPPAPVAAVAAACSFPNGSAGCARVPVLGLSEWLAQELPAAADVVVVEAVAGAGAAVETSARVQSAQPPCAAPSSVRRSPFMLSQHLGSPTDPLAASSQQSAACQPPAASGAQQAAADGRVDRKAEAEVDTRAVATATCTPAVAPVPLLPAISAGVTQQGLPAGGAAAAHGDGRRPARKRSRSRCRAQAPQGPAVQLPPPQTAAEWVERALQLLQELPGHTASLAQLESKNLHITEPLLWETGCKSAGAFLRHFLHLWRVSWDHPLAITAKPQGQKQHADQQAVEAEGGRARSRSRGRSTSRHRDRSGSRGRSSSRAGIQDCSRSRACSLSRSRSRGRSGSRESSPRRGVTRDEWASRVVQLLLKQPGRAMVWNEATRAAMPELEIPDHLLEDGQSPAAFLKSFRGLWYASPSEPPILTALSGAEAFLAQCRNSGRSPEGGRARSRSPGRRQGRNRAERQRGHPDVEGQTATQAQEAVVQQAVSGPLVVVEERAGEDGFRGAVGPGDTRSANLEAELQPQAAATAWPSDPRVAAHAEYQQQQQQVRSPAPVQLGVRGHEQGLQPSVPFPPSPVRPLTAAPQHHLGPPAGPPGDASQTAAARWLPTQQQQPAGVQLAGLDLPLAAAELSGELPPHGQPPGPEHNMVAEDAMETEEQESEEEVLYHYEGRASDAEPDAPAPDDAPAAVPLSIDRGDFAEAEAEVEAEEGSEAGCLAEGLEGQEHDEAEEEAEQGAEAEEEEPEAEAAMEGTEEEEAEEEAEEAEAEEAEEAEGSEQGAAEEADAGPAVEAEAEEAEEEAAVVSESEADSEEAAGEEGESAAEPKVEGESDGGEEEDKEAAEPGVEGEAGVAVEDEGTEGADSEADLEAEQEEEAESEQEAQDQAEPQAGPGTEVAEPHGEAATGAAAAPPAPAPLLPAANASVPERGLPAGGPAAAHGDGGRPARKRSRSRYRAQAPQGPAVQLPPPQTAAEWVERALQLLQELPGHTASLAQLESKNLYITEPLLWETGCKSAGAFLRHFLHLWRVSWGQPLAITARPQGQQHQQQHEGDAAEGGRGQSRSRGRSASRHRGRSGSRGRSRSRGRSSSRTASTLTREEWAAGVVQLLLRQPGRSAVCDGRMQADMRELEIPLHLLSGWHSCTGFLKSFPHLWSVSHSQPLTLTAKPHLEAARARSRSRGRSSSRGRSCREEARQGKGSSRGPSPGGETRRAGAKSSSKNRGKGEAAGSRRGSRSRGRGVDCSDNNQQGDGGDDVAVERLVWSEAVLRFLDTRPNRTAGYEELKGSDLAIPRRLRGCRSKAHFLGSFPDLWTLTPDGPLVITALDRQPPTHPPGAQRCGADSSRTRSRSRYTTSGATGGGGGEGGRGRSRSRSVDSGRRGVGGTGPAT